MSTFIEVCNEVTEFVKCPVASGNPTSRCDDCSANTGIRTDSPTFDTYVRLLTAYLMRILKREITVQEEIPTAPCKGIGRRGRELINSAK